MILKSLDNVISNYVPTITFSPPSKPEVHHCSNTQNFTGAPSPYTTYVVYI